MIRIIYTSERFKGEPGPNFVWRGTPKDYLSLIVDLHQLCKPGNAEIDLNQFGYIHMEGNFKVIAVSSEDGNILNKKMENRILIDLSPPLWRELFQGFLSLSFCPCHDYVDFEGMNLQETANFIISSEG